MLTIHVVEHNRKGCEKGKELLLAIAHLGILAPGWGPGAFYIGQNTKERSSHDLGS